MEWLIKEQGKQVVIEVRYKDKGDGLYKAYAIGENGSFLLGTLIPENGNLCLRRTLTVDGLKRYGVWPVKGVECRMTHPFQETVPTIPWVDDVLRCSARRLPRHTVRRNGSGFVLSVPFDPRRPFPLIPLFCLSRVEHGRLLFFFLADGTPHIFRAEGNNRRETNTEGGKRDGKLDHQGAGCAGRSAGF